MTNSTAPDSTGLVRGMTRGQAVAMVVGSMIGTGAFIVSADMVRQVHHPGLVLLAWALGGVVLVLGGLTYAELGGMFPLAGGLYVYLREAFSPLVGFLYGWTLFTVIWTGGTAAVALGFARYASVLFPGLTPDLWIGTTVALPTGPITVGLSPQRLLAVLLIVGLTWINVRGVKTAAAIQAAFTVAKVAAVVAVILLGFTIGRNPAAVAANFGAGFWPAVWTPAVTTGLATALIGPLFTLDGWYSLCFAASELENPKRDLPFALVSGTIFISVLFLLLHGAYFAVLPAAAVGAAEQDRVASTVMAAMFGPIGEQLMAAAIMISAFGLNLGLLLGGARVFYAMAQDGYFFRRAARIHPRYRTPAAALVVQGLWISLLCLSGTYGQLVDFVLAASLIFYVLIPIGLIVLRMRRPDAERPVRVPGYPIVPLAYAAATAWVLVQMVINRPQYTWPGLILLAIGVPVYVGRRRLLSARARLQLEEERR
jgi:APA family basic amino acid/polyamine antiporter